MSWSVYTIVCFPVDVYRSAIRFTRCHGQCILYCVSLLMFTGQLSGSPEVVVSVYHSVFCY